MDENEGKDKLGLVQNWNPQDELERISVLIVSDHDEISILHEKLLPSSWSETHTWPRNHRS